MLNNSRTQTLGVRQNPKYMEPLWPCLSVYICIFKHTALTHNISSPLCPPSHIWLTLKPGFLPLFFGTLSGGRDSG